MLVSDFVFIIIIICIIVACTLWIKRLVPWDCKFIPNEEGYKTTYNSEVGQWSGQISNL